MSSTCRPCRFTLHPSVSLRAVAERLPFTYTGADFYALCSDAMLKAVTRQAAAVDAKIAAINAQREGSAAVAMSTAYYFDHHATPDDLAVLVTEDDFGAAHRELVPSVSAGELAHYEKVRATFEGVRRGDGLDDGARRASASAPIPPHVPRNNSRVGSGSGRAKGKGKGKAVAPRSDEEFDDDSSGGGGRVNGRAKGKGKASAMGFQDGTASDDDGLY